jgi:26S proteasome regulatory subunit N1
VSISLSQLTDTIAKPGQQEASDATLETLKAIEHNVSKQAQILVEICSYAGTSNVLKVQAMLHHCNDHLEKKDDNKVDDTYQAFAVIGIALVAMGEDVGAEMALRQFNHLVSIFTLRDRFMNTEF